MIENDYINFKYQIIQKLGQGAFGMAYLAKDKFNKKVVIKDINLNNMSISQRSSLIQEGPILYKLSNENIVKFIEFFFDDSKAFLVMEFAEGGDLSKKLIMQRQKKEPFKEQQILIWCLELCRAIKCCHDNDIIHRDIKPANIFLTKDNHIKLGDLGIAKILSSNTKKTDTLAGTELYMPPEVFYGEKYTFSFDIWSLGIVLYELCLLKHPCFLVKMDSQGNLNFVEMKYYSKGLNDLIKRILKRNPEERPKIDELIKICIFMLNKKKKDINPLIISDPSDPLGNILINHIEKKLADMFIKNIISNILFGQEQHTERENGKYEQSRKSTIDDNEKKETKITNNRNRNAISIDKSQRLSNLEKTFLSIKTSEDTKE